MVQMSPRTLLAQNASIISTHDDTHWQEEVCVSKDGIYHNVTYTCICPQTLAVLAQIAMAGTLIAQRTCGATQPTQMGMISAAEQDKPFWYVKLGCIEHGLSGLHLARVFSAEHNFEDWMSQGIERNCQICSVPVCYTVICKLLS